MLCIKRGNEDGEGLLEFSNNVDIPEFLDMVSDVWEFI